MTAGHIEVQRRGLLDAREGDGHVAAAGLKGDPVDGGSAGEHEEGLGHDASLHVAQELQADGAAALGGVGREEAQVAAPPVPVRTRVGPCKANTQASDVATAEQQREGATGPPLAAARCLRTARPCFSVKQRDTRRGRRR